MNYIEIKGFTKGQISTSKVGVGRESDGVVRYARNVRLSNGNVLTRAGWERYCDFGNQIALNNKTIRCLGEYQRESYSGGVTSYWRVAVFTTEDKFWYIKTEDSTNFAIQIIGHPQTAWEFRYVNVYDHLWIFNGRDPVYVWDGITVRKVGIPKPLKNLTLTNNVATGTLYMKYKHTYYRTAAPYNKESEPSDPVMVSNVKSTNVNVKVDYTLALGEVIDPQVTHIMIYRTMPWDPLVDEENTAYYLVRSVTIAQAVIDGYILNPADLSEDVTGSTPYDVTERGVPPVSKYGLWHDSRLFLAGDPENPSVIYYSESGKPFYFPTLNYDEVNRDDGNVITGIGAIGPTRYIFKERTIYEWTGNPVTASPIRQVERQDATQNMARVAVGCSYPDTLVGWNNSLIFRDYDGDVYMLTQTSLVNLSKYYDEVRNLGSSCAAYVKDDYYIIGASDESYACHLPTQAWESMDTVTFNYVLVRHNGDVLVPDYYTLSWKDGQGNDITTPCINRLGIGVLDNEANFIKVIQTKYEKVANNEDDVIIRAVRVYCSIQLPFFVTIFNEKGESTFGTYDVAKKRFTTPESIRLRARWVSVRLLWTGSTEIYGVDVGYIRRQAH